MIPIRYVKNKAILGALEDCKRTNRSLESIAKTRGITKELLVRCAAAAGVPVGTARRRFRAPTVTERKILILAETLTPYQIGFKLDMHAGEVGRLLSDCRSWIPKKFTPFTPGDIIELRGERYTLTAVRGLDVDALTRDGEVRRLFLYATQRDGLRLVGHDPKFVVFRQPPKQRGRLKAADLFNDWAGFLMPPLPPSIMAELLGRRKKKVRG